MDSARSATTLDLSSIARKARKSNRTFKEILRALPASTAEQMYSVYHEAPEERFASTVDDIRREKLPETRLRRIRSAIGTRLAFGSVHKIKVVQPDEFGNRLWLSADDKILAKRRDHLAMKRQPELLWRTSYHFFELKCNGQNTHF